MMTMYRPIRLFFVIVAVSAAVAAAAATGGSSSSSTMTTLIDNKSGGLVNLGTTKTATTTSMSDVVTVISSPGMTSLLIPQADEDAIMSLRESDGLLICRGATLTGDDNMSLGERTALTTASLVSTSIIIDGVTVGDVEAGLSYQTRHARTLSVLFQSKLLSLMATNDEDEDNNNNSRQTLIFAVKSSSDEDDIADMESKLLPGLQRTFDAMVVETKFNNKKNGISLKDLYDIQVVTVSNSGEAKEVLELAKTAAASSSSMTLSSALENANERIKTSIKVSELDVTPPYIAHAMVTVSNSFAKQSKYVRAKIAGWKSRATRGLWTDGFGAEAETVRRRALSSFDSETLATAGIVQVSPYRMEQRTKLASLIDTAITELFTLQVTNLQQRTLKKIRAQLLKKLDVTPPEDVPSENAAAVRAALFAFDTIMNELEVPSLSLTKVQPRQEMERSLMDVVSSFDDSNEAKIKRLKKIDVTTNKEKKVGKRSIDFGLNLVTVLRPDGYGNFQGYAGYALGGNQLIFGIHNDADDPTAIAQFGGVRPPLLRIQPQLKVDVEM